MSKECPRCGHKGGWGFTLLRCRKCDGVFCEKCAKGFMVGKCPFCNSKDVGKL